LRYVYQLHEKLFGLVLVAALYKEFRWFIKVGGVAHSLAWPTRLPYMLAQAVVMFSICPENIMYTHVFHSSRRYLGFANANKKVGTDISTKHGETSKVVLW